jgi:hypothetical protein
VASKKVAGVPSGGDAERCENTGVAGKRIQKFLKRKKLQIDGWRGTAQKEIAGKLFECGRQGDLRTLVSDP